MRLHLATAIALPLLTLFETPLVAAEIGAREASPQRPRRHYTIQQFIKTEHVQDISFSADEREILFSSDRSGIINVHKIPITGDAAEPVTRSKTESTYAVSFFPSDDRVLYQRDRGGNENDHLYVRRLGEPDASEVDLTPGEEVKAIFLDWSPERDAFYVQTNERDARFFDLYRFDTKTLARTILYENRSGWDILDLSPGERWIALVKPNTTADADLYLQEVGGKEPTHLTPHQGNVNYAAPEFGPDGRWLYYLTDEGSEFQYVERLELSSGNREAVERADWDIDRFELSRDGRYRATTINADGASVLRVTETTTGGAVALPDLPVGDISSPTFSRSGTKLAFYSAGDRAPDNLYVLDLASEKVSRLTDTLNPEIDPEDLVEARVVRFPSFDGMQIPNVLYLPLQASASHKVPALVYVHGGPGGQTRRGYGALRQYLLNHGYAVLGINNRGSSGYGKSFYVADDGKHGREPLWDCVAGKNYLASLPEIDAERIGILGGSYGGYMVLAALAFQPDAFRVGVDLFGISNWIRTLESIPPYWESFRKALYVEIGDPQKDRAALEAVSPLTHAGKIQRPLMVLQGKNDPRVILAESDDIVAAVKKNGVPVEYVVFDDEGHGFVKKENEIEGYEAILRFLDRYLKGAGEPARSETSPSN